MELLNEDASRLLEMAGALLLASMRVAGKASDPKDTQAAWKVHDDEKLYPRIVVTSPHGGGAIRLEATLCNPTTDEPIVRLVCLEAEAEVSH